MKVRIEVWESFKALCEGQIHKRMRNYVTDFADKHQRNVFAEQCRNALKAGQAIVSHKNMGKKK